MLCECEVGVGVANSSRTPGDEGRRKGTTAVNTPTSTTGLALVLRVVEDPASEVVREDRCTRHTGGEDWSRRNDLRNLTARCAEACWGGVESKVKERGRR